MNERQKRFCEYYVGECIGNVAQSAIKAGYSETYSYKMGHRLLENIGVKEYIRALSADNEKKRIATADDIRLFWTDVLNNEREETKDRLRASELLAKSNGMFANDW